MHAMVLIKRDLVPVDLVHLPDRALFDRLVIANSAVFSPSKRRVQGPRLHCRRSRTYRQIVSLMVLEIGRKSYKTTAVHPEGTFPYI